MLTRRQSSCLTVALELVRVQTAAGPSGAMLWYSVESRCWPRDGALNRDYIPAVRWPSPFVPLLLPGRNSAVVRFRTSCDEWVWRRRCTRPLPPTILHKPVTQGSLRTSLVESHPQDRSQYGMHPSLLRPAGRATPATGAAAALGLPNLLPSDPAPEYQDWQEARSRERSPLTEQGSSVAACHRDSLPAWFALPENLTHRLIATDPPHTAMSLQDSLERCSRWWSYCSLSSFTICPVQCKLDRP